MEIEKVVERIAQQRNKKGFTYENMAHELDITAAAYRKIETGETKLSVERLMKIADILEAKLEELLDLKADKIYQQEFKDNSNNYQEFQNLHQENKEVYQELIKSKDDQIALLKEQVAFLTKKNT